MSEIDVKLKAQIDQAVAALKQVEDGLRGVGASQKDANHTADEGKGTMQSLRLAWTEFNSELMVAQKGLELVKQGWAATFGEYTKFAEQVYRVKTDIGATAQDASRLLVASQNVGVGSEALTMGLEQAIRRGISPTIEGLAKLADQYNAIDDPIARTKFLLDTFGRSGADLAPLLAQGSEGIKKLGEEADKTGQVLDELALKKARLAEMELNNLGDTARGIGIQIGEVMTPGVLLGATAIQRLIENVKAGNFSTWDWATKSVKEWGEKMVGTKNAANDLGGAAQENAANVAADAKAAEDAAAAFQKYSENLLATQGPMGQVASAQRALTQGTQDWGKVGGDAKQQLDRYFVTGSKQWIAAAQELDSVTGSNIVQQFNYEQAIKKATEAFRSGKVDVEGYGKAIEAAGGKAGLTPLSQLMKDADASQQKVHDLFAAIPHDTYSYLHVVTIYTTQYGGQGASEKASGGPLDRGVNIVGEEGYELVIDGVVIPHSQSVQMMEAGLVPRKGFRVTEGADYVAPASTSDTVPVVDSSYNTEIAATQRYFASSAYSPSSGGASHSQIAQAAGAAAAQAAAKAQAAQDANTKEVQGAADKVGQDTEQNTLLLGQKLDLIAFKLDTMPQRTALSMTAILNKIQPMG